MDSALVGAVADAKEEAALAKALDDLGAGALGQPEVPDDVAQTAATGWDVAQDVSLVLAQVGIIPPVQGHPDRSVRSVEQFGI
jgi:hypothetical protein